MAEEEVKLDDVVVGERILRGDLIAQFVSGCFHRMDSNPVRSAIDLAL
jgi:hypothetical protein